MSKLQELNRQLDAERTRVKKEKKEQEKKARLVIAANRLPVTPTRDHLTGEWHFKRSSGGLVSAFLGVNHYDITWVGWVGAEVPDAEKEAITAALREQKPFTCVPVYLDEETADNYYNGFSNNVLWPLLHYIPLSMLDSHTSLAELQWKAYQDANRAFAEAVLSLQLDDSDLVWVQDYHLMLVPKYLRDHMPRLSIGWFLHTPFTTSEMYRTLPHREEILRGVLGADLCGFHIYDYGRHFHTSCARVLGIGGDTGITEGNDGIFDHASRRSICVDTFPIGIEPQRFEHALETPQVKDKIIEMQRRFDGKKVLLGIDRLDYVKGIPHKLKALEYFLQTYPQWRGKVVLLQIAVPSRQEVPGYQKLRSNVHRSVSRINGAFGSLDDVPIHYLDQSMGFPELCALYFRADIMFVTSLRDGMNLVSFEYIACQQKRHGVLLLSEFAGAAQALGAGALLINPYNTEEVAKCLFEGLNMPQKEREERFMYMHNHIYRNTSQEWADQFVASLRHARQASNYDAGPFADLSQARALPKEEVVTSYKACERSGSPRLIIFGLLGTLIDYNRFHNFHSLLPSVRRNLATLALAPNNTLVVCSGRERALMNEWLGDLPIWLVAENGLWIRPPATTSDSTDGGGAWEMLREDVDNGWMEQLKSVFKYFEARTPDTFTEVQEHTITWHYQESNDDFAEVQAGDLQAHLTKVSGNAPVEVGLDMKRVEVRPYGVSKGGALSTILERLCPKRRSASTYAHELHEDSLASSLTGECEVDLSLAERNHFRWVLCVGEVMARDEDLFTTLQSLFDESQPKQHEHCKQGDEPSSKLGRISLGPSASYDEPEHLFTCCVGKRLSQADFALDDDKETAGLLDLLAHASYDAVTPDVPLMHQRTPSVLERLHQLVRQLVGKQLLFLFDYDGCAAAGRPPGGSTSSLTGMSGGTVSDPIHTLLTLYPTAVVLRHTVEQEEREAWQEARESWQEGTSAELSLRSPSHLGEISGVQILAFTQPVFPRTTLRSAPSSAVGGAALVTQSVSYEYSFRPALESCLCKLHEKLNQLQVTLEDNNFSLSVIHRGASDEEHLLARDVVLETVRSEFPMLRCIEGRLALEIRPDVEWNRAKAAKAVVETVVDRVVNQLGLRGVVPIYIGEAPDFDMTQADGINILVTGGPGTQSYFLRDASQVDQLLRWFIEQHQAGVTVRGGKLQQRAVEKRQAPHGGSVKHESRDWHNRPSIASRQTPGSRPILTASVPRAEHSDMSG